VPGKCRSFVDIVCFAFRIDVVTKCVRGQSTVDRSKNFVSRLFGFCGFDPSPYQALKLQITTAYCHTTNTLPQVINRIYHSDCIRTYLQITWTEKIDNILAHQHHTSHQFCKLFTCTNASLKMLNTSICKHKSSTDLSLRLQI